MEDKRKCHDDANGVAPRRGDMRHIDGNLGTGNGSDGNRGRMTTALVDVATTRSLLDGTLQR
jgi:hypothetical protein